MSCPSSSRSDGVRLAQGGESPAGKVIIIVLSNMFSLAVASPVLLPTLVILVLVPAYDLWIALLALVLGRVRAARHPRPLPHQPALSRQPAARPEKRILETVTQEVE